MARNRIILATFAMVGGLVVLEPLARATVTFQGTLGSDLASADFTISGNDLKVTLTNTSTDSSFVYHNPDLLSGLFFAVDGSTATLAANSATSPTGVTVNGGACITTCDATTTNVGGEWAYVFSSGGFTGSGGALSTAARFAVAAAGYSNETPAFGSGDIIGGPALGHSTAPDGLGFSIVGDNYDGGTSHVDPVQPLIQKAVDFDFTITGTLSEGDITNVTFGYGTAPDASDAGITGHNNDTPEPASIALLGVALTGLAAVRKRRGRSGHSHDLNSGAPNRVR